MKPRGGRASSLSLLRGFFHMLILMFQSPVPPPFLPGCLPMAVVLFKSCLGIHIVEEHGCSFPVISRTQNLTADFLVLWLLQSSQLYFPDVPYVLGGGVVLLRPDTSWVLVVCLWPVGVSCNSLYLLQAEVFWWGVKLHCDYKYQYSECKWKLCCFSKRCLCVFLSDP